MLQPTLIPDTRAMIRIESPAQPTQRIALLLPGISGEVFSARYDALASACTDAGIALGRVEIWKDSENAQDLTVADIHATLKKVIAYAKAQGYTSIYAIGKSFGGAMWLTLRSPELRAQVLWAPAIAVADTASTYESYRAVQLSQVPSLTSVTIDADFLAQSATPTLIIHGTADLLVPFSNSEKMIAHMPHAQLAAIEGADHSYHTPEHYAEVIQKTVAFLSNQI